MSIALITGGSSGIGQAAAMRVAQRGSAVVLTYNSNEQGAVKTVSRIEETGGRAVAMPLDVGRVDTFPAFRDDLGRTLRDLGADALTGLVNNAGFGQMATFEETTEELFDTLCRTIVKGPYFLTQTLLPLLADGASVVNTTSSSALYHGVEPGYSAYGSMKGAVVVLTRYLAKELGARGIRVNSVAPGPTRTRISQDAFERFPEVVRPLAARTTLGRIGEADDIGAVIAFLLSDEGRWVTAQDLEVSGGFGL